MPAPRRRCSSTPRPTRADGRQSACAGDSASPGGGPSPRRRAPAGSAPRPVVAAAAALEVFHAAALVHDDVIDNSDTRRGRPAAHRALEAAHRDAGWVGDAAAFGRSAAILLGDLLVAWSDDLLEEGLAEHHARPRGRGAPEYAADAPRGHDRPVPRHRRGVGVRAPSPTSGTPSGRCASHPSSPRATACSSRSRSARRSRERMPRRRRRWPRSGIRSAWRSSCATTCSASSATSARPASPRATTCARASAPCSSRTRARRSRPRARRIVDELIGDPDLDAEQIASLQRTIVDTGALDRVEALIADYAREADRALSGARLGNAAVGELRDLARAATVRTT